MFVVSYKSRTPDKKYFKVIESFRVGPKVKKRHIISLAYHRTVQDAYQAELAKYLKASDKLERLEHILLHMQPKGA